MIKIERLLINGKWLGYEEYNGRMEKEREKIIGIKLINDRKRAKELWENSLEGVKR